MMAIEIISQQKIDELRAAGKLPSPGGVALAIMEKSQQEGVTVQEISLLIQSDPALAGRLMKYANSAALGGRRPIASVPDAVHRVGLSAVRHLVLGFSLISSTHYAPCPGFDYPMFWARSLATAIANRALSLQTHVSADEAFTFGLLCGIGKLALASLYPDSFGQVLEAASTGQASLPELENEHYAIDHRALTYSLLKDWGFPNIFLETAYYHDDPDACGFEQGSRHYALIHGLHLATCLAEACLLDDISRQNRLPLLFTKAARLGIEAGELAELCARIDVEWREWGDLLGVPTPHLLSISSSPRSPGEPNASPALSGAGNAVAPLRILAIDDDPVLRTLLEKLLALKGYQVRIAADGKEGLRLAVEFAPQIIITDWMMPEMDGLAMCRALRGSEEGERVYVILLTAQETEDRLVEAFDAGADDYIVKPFNKRVLMARLHAGERIIRLHEALTRKELELRAVVSDLAITVRQLHDLAMKDPLTRLPNRRQGLERMEQEWTAVNRRQNRSLSVLLLDIDRFKQVNDQHGHGVGDEVLKFVARIIEQSARAEDLPCRLGGEEFLVICPETGLKAAQTVAERIRKEIEATELPTAAGMLRVTASIGVAERTPAISSPAELVRLADKAMYAAKNAGRNRVVAIRGAGMVL